MRPAAAGALQPVVEHHGAVTTTLFMSDSCFSVSRWDIDGDAVLPMPAPYLLAGCIAGSGAVNGVSIKTGDHFIVPSANEVELSGRCSLMVTSPGAE